MEEPYVEAMIRAALAEAQAAGVQSAQIVERIS